MWGATTRSTTTHPKKSMGIYNMTKSYSFDGSSKTGQLFHWKTLPSFGLNVVQNMDVSWCITLRSRSNLRLDMLPKKVESSNIQNAGQIFIRKTRKANPLETGNIREQTMRGYQSQMLPSGDQAWRAETGNLHASDVRGYNKLLSLFMHDPIILNPHILVFMNSPLFK